MLVGQVCGLLSLWFLLLVSAGLSQELVLGQKVALQFTISDLARLVSVNGKLVLTNQNRNHAKVFIRAENFECNSPQHMHDDEPVTCMSHEELCRPTVLRCGTIKLKMFLRT